MCKRTDALYFRNADGHLAIPETQIGLHGWGNALLVEFDGVSLPYERSGIPSWVPSCEETQSASSDLSQPVIFAEFRPVDTIQGHQSIYAGMTLCLRSEDVGEEEVYVVPKEASVPGDWADTEALLAERIEAVIQEALGATDIVSDISDIVVRIDEGPPLSHNIYGSICSERLSGLSLGERQGILLNILSSKFGWDVNFIQAKFEYYDDCLN